MNYWQHDQVKGVMWYFPLIIHKFIIWSKTWQPKGTDSAIFDSAQMKIQNSNSRPMANNIRLAAYYYRTCEFGDNHGEWA